MLRCALRVPLWTARIQFALADGALHDLVPGPSVVRTEAVGPVDEEQSNLAKKTTLIGTSTLSAQV
jgi:hypothetical protein